MDLPLHGQEKTGEPIFEFPCKQGKKGKLMDHVLFLLANIKSWLRSKKTDDKLSARHREVQLVQKWPIPDV